MRLAPEWWGEVPQYFLHTSFALAQVDTNSSAPFDIFTGSKKPPAYRLLASVSENYLNFKELQSQLFVPTLSNLLEAER